MLLTLLRKGLYLTLLTTHMSAQASGAADRLGLSEEIAKDFTLIPREALPLYDNLPEDMVSPQHREGRKLADDLFNSMAPEGSFDPFKDVSDDQIEFAKGLARGAAGIADKAFADERGRVLDLMGLSDDQGRVYVFVSFSMPEELIQAYAREAMWSGAILVVKGVPDGYDLRTFITEKLYMLVGKKGASAAIQIDPRLYDVFQVSAVPTIVYTEIPEYDLCLDTYEQPYFIGDQPIPIAYCEPVSDDAYWSITGSVTIDYALEAFMLEGADGAGAHLATLRESGFYSSKEQQPFEGNWDEVGIPEDRFAILDMLRTNRTLYETPFGIAGGPAGLEDEANSIKAIDP